MSPATASRGVPGASCRAEVIGGKLPSTLPTWPGSDLIETNKINFLTKIIGGRLDGSWTRLACIETGRKRFHFDTTPCQLWCGALSGHGSPALCRRTEIVAKVASQYDAASSIWCVNSDMKANMNTIANCSPFSSKNLPFHKITNSHIHMAIPKMPYSAANRRNWLWVLPLCDQNWVAPAPAPKTGSCRKSFHPALMTLARSSELSSSNVKFEKKLSRDRILLDAASSSCRE